MVKRFYVLLLLLVAIINFLSCSGSMSGTEVVNTPNPQTPQETKLSTDYYDFKITLPVGWVMIVYDNNTVPGAEAFSDSDPATDTVATFLAGDQGYFTVFASALGQNETLEQFVRIRRPTGDIQTDVETADDGTVVTIDLYKQEVVGTRGGSVFDVYEQVDSDLLWMRCELVGSSAEQEATWNDFWDMVKTISFN